VTGVRAKKAFCRSSCRIYKQHITVNIDSMVCYREDSIRSGKCGFTIALLNKPCVITCVDRLLIPGAYDKGVAGLGSRSKRQRDH
jgi:hypothetical protein